MAIKTTIAKKKPKPAVKTPKTLKESEAEKQRNRRNK